MEYCTRCVYPSNARPAIFFDSEGVCSGCRYHESREKVDWIQKELELQNLLDEQAARQQKKGNPYDCIIPVSGGKDSTWQVHLIKEVYGLNPLLITANHVYNSELGLRNLRNLVNQFNCDLVRFTISPNAVRKISRWAMMEMGDLTFHYHAAIMTLPMRAAVQWDVPLVIWGEEGFSEMVGMFQLQDEVEYTRWRALEHDQRGYDREDLIGKGEGKWEITEADVEFMRYPSRDDIERVGVRGIYLSNYLPWDGYNQAKFVHEEKGFELATQRERTFLTYSKLEDHANDVHDYLKYLKFGYGRATDDASTEIRHGRISREEGLELVNYLDRVRPVTWRTYMNWLELEDGDVLFALARLVDNAIEVRDRFSRIPQWEYLSGRACNILDLYSSHRPYYTRNVGRRMPTHPDYNRFTTL